MDVVTGLGYLGTLNQLLGGWVRRGLAARGDVPVVTSFHPVFEMGGNLSGSVAMVPMGYPPDAYPDNRFAPPSEWQDGARILSECAFLLKVRNQSTTAFPRRLQLAEVGMSVEEVEPLHRDRATLRWSLPPGAGGGGAEPVEDVLGPNRRARLIILRQEHLPPTVFLLRHFRAPRAPVDGYPLGPGQEFLFPMKFHFPASGDYRLTFRLYLTEDGRELTPISVRQRYSIHQADDLNALPALDEAPGGCARQQLLESLMRERTRREQAVEQIPMTLMFGAPLQGPVVGLGDD